MYISVVFDLEEGPVIESVFPEFPLSETDKTDMYDRRTPQFDSLI
jgi:hypothetical protein